MSQFKLLPHQYDFVTSEHTITVMLCARSVGKTFAASVLLLKKLLENKNGLIIAPTFKTIKDAIMPQIIDTFTAAGLVQGKHYSFNKSDLTITMNTGAKVYSRSAERSDSPRGLTNLSFMYVDEAAFLDEDIYSVGLLTLRGADVRHPQVYITSSPSSSSHWTSKLAKLPTTKHITATIFDNKHTGEAFHNLMVEQLANLPEAFVRRELYGEIVDLDTNSIFTRTEWNSLTAIKEWNTFKTIVGIDVAGGGDFSSITAINGNRVIAIEKMLTPELDDLRTFVIAHCNRLKPDIIRIDTGGLGHFLPNELQKMFPNAEIQGVNFGGSAKKPYNNARTEMYFSIKDRIAEGLHFDPNINKKYITEIEEEMFATPAIDSNGLLALPKKDIIKRQIGRSPDITDSFALACYDIKGFESSIEKRITNERLVAAANPFRHKHSWN